MKVWARWYGGVNYANDPEPETFASLAEARRVFDERRNGWDPVSQKRTPCVTDRAEMYVWDEDPTLDHDRDGFEADPVVIISVGRHGATRVDPR